MALIGANLLKMKRMAITIILIFLIYLLSSCSSPYSERNLFGIWRGELHGQELLFAFNSDQTCKLSFVDKASGSTLSLKGNFILDFSKKPVPLTIRNIPQLNHALHTIISFRGRNSIQIAEFAPRWRLRPLTFNNRSSILLKRVEERTKAVNTSLIVSRN
ncbi:MAG: hypothetical protein ACYTBV_06580 [Planctomycetota bacterium]|jgi:hypothetical protein